MGNDLLKMNATPTGMRLTDWVAKEEGFFERQGLDVQVDWKVLERQRATQGTKADTDYQDFKQSRLNTFLSKSELSTACAWGVCTMAGAGLGKFVPGVHGVSPCGIFVRADSEIQTPEDLKGVPIAVGLRAGSHFSALHHLEKHLSVDDIEVVNVGGFTAVLQALISGEVEASSLLPPQVYMAPQLGMRQIIGGEFKTMWWVNESADADKVTRYLRAIEMAEAALDEDLERYLPLWKYSTSEELTSYDWDYSQFGRGERFVRSPIDEDEFHVLLSQASRWGLDNHMTERVYEELMYQPARA